MHIKQHTTLTHMRSHTIHLSRLRNRVTAQPDSASVTILDDEGTAAKF